MEVLAALLNFWKGNPLATDGFPFLKYHKISNISGTKSQNLNDSRFVLQMSLPNPLKTGAKSRMKM